MSSESDEEEEIVVQKPAPPPLRGILSQGGPSNNIGDILSQGPTNNSPFVPTTLKSDDPFLYVPEKKFVQLAKDVNVVPERSPAVKEKLKRISLAKIARFRETNHFTN